MKKNLLSVLVILAAFELGSLCHFSTAKAQSEPMYQISAVHSGEEGSAGDSVYRLNMVTGQVCHMGSGLGPLGINECF